MGDVANKQGADDLSKLSEFIKENKEAVYLYAANNTPKNKEGIAVISKDDEWRLDEEWDKREDKNKNERSLSKLQWNV